MRSYGPPLGEHSESDDDAHSFPVARCPEERCPRHVFCSLFLHLERVSDLRHFEDDEWIAFISAVGMEASECASSFALLFVQ